MNCTDCTAKLHDYVDGDLAAAERRAVDAHLATCAGCRLELESLRALRAQTQQLPAEVPPSRDLWPALRAEVERLDPKPLVRGSVEGSLSGLGSSHATFRIELTRWLAPLALAASVALLFTVAQRRFAPPPREAAWSVAALAGAPRVDRKTVEHDAAFRVGQWLETDAASRARVTVGAIGVVTVDPNSRLRLATAAATDHRLELARGSLSATIWAPPRLFFVDTPSATAVDLGCAYTLNVADDGAGELHVTAGYVALEHGPRESIIPARAMCLTRRGAGPGTPFAEDAPAALREALERFDFTPGAAASALPAILASARADDAITLWHLLARTAGRDRALTFDALAQHHAPPAGVTREGILRGDAAMRRAWAAELGLGAFAAR